MILADRQTDRPARHPY